MSTKSLGQSWARDGARELRRAWHALAALIVIGSAACGTGESNGAAPPTPGSISLTTQTSGFMKDDSYELLVDGTSRGTIGANDQMTVVELDPATYAVDLGDVASNCVTESVSVPVASGETVEVALTIVCTYAEPTPYNVRFIRDRPNLDNGEITDCIFGICPSGADQWDVYVHENTQASPRSIIRQNQQTGVQIAHLPGVTLAALTEADVAGATFGTALVADPFDAGRVILIKTNEGKVYALGNPVEDTMTQRLTFDAALVSVP